MKLGCRSLYFTFLIIYAFCECKETKRQEIRKFPDGFLFGTATSAYQVEGAWNEDGKSESIWDYETHKIPSTIIDGSTGDIADDSYCLYERDVEMIRELGLNFYRFSISWTRVLPTSFPDKINEAGVLYYNNLINELLKYNIEPMVTIYHWDLPQKLQELGGWTNPYVVDWFADYARVLFELFGDRVKTWITINEPQCICHLSYGDTYFAPKLDWPGVPQYLCTKNLLLAHAKVYHMYNNEYRSDQGGRVGITIVAQWYEPDSEEHTVAADESNQFQWGMFVHPIFSDTGDYPLAVKERIAAKSKEQGYTRSRLPELTPTEVEYVRGTADFFGLNHYSSSYVYRNSSVEGLYPIPSFSDDEGILKYSLPEWQLGESKMMLYVPWGFYKVLTKIKDTYNNPPIYITENGLSSYGGLVDDDRVMYFRGYLDALLDAIDNGSDIRGYTAWSLMDNFEWSSGYTERFGLYEVDFTSPSRTRTPRKSAFVYKEIVRTGTLDFGYEPDTAIMTIDEGH